MRPSLLIPLLLLAAPLRAQPAPGDCVPGAARDSLDVNQALAPLFNDGSLFDNSSNISFEGYRTADAPDAIPLFETFLWLAGSVEGEARASATWFGSPGFWPGPLETGGALPNPADCSAYDRIWNVSRQDVARYLATGEATDDLLEWPVDLGAPVLDGDGIPGNYNLEGGDQPAIRGDQMAWWVMNDVGNEQLVTGSAPMGLEVRVEAFAAEGRGAAPGALDPATFYRYTLTNRTGQPIDSTFAGWMMNPASNLSHLGSDTTSGLAYAYSWFDIPAYGRNPPAWGGSVIEGPVGMPNGRDDDGDGLVDESGERLGTTTVGLVFNGGPMWSVDPRTPEEFILRMSGYWNDGEPIREGDAGHNPGGGGDIVQFVFPGDPTLPAFWSALRPDREPPHRPIIVSRFFLATGPFRLDPGETETVTFAVTYGRGFDRFSSIRVLWAYTDEVHFQYGIGALDPRPVTAAEFESPELPEETTLPEGVRFVRPSPNPFRGPLALRYEVPAPTPLRLSVYDALGREVAVLFDGTAEAGAHEAVLDGAALAPGVYVVRLAVPGGSRALALTRAPARF
ncbi:MAG: T9SS type A sorting domain-containing protein [Rubricoccaceae bacterium]|nr:T9SS type A sorting domain-containing protein [Rubricoccaceae bacterium]